MNIFLTGATGYIGGRLAPRLLDGGHQLRCLVRSASKLRSRYWADHPCVQIVEADAGNPSELTEAMRGCDVAYYLIHSMQAAGTAYAERDNDLAATFARAAEAASVKRIIYLGGLGETGAQLSEHLASRRAVESALAGGSVPVTIFRAAMIIGSGSASFEILRYLTERLPIMITPRWVHTECQPIAVGDVLHYLATAIDTPETSGQTIDIGGPEVVTYRDLIHEMARALNLPRRWIIPVPVLTPRLSALWLYLITPVPYRIAKPLAEGLRNKVVCRDDTATRLMPSRLMTVSDAIAAALRHEGGDTQTAWTDAGVIPGDPDWAGGTVLTDQRAMTIDATAEEVFAAISKIGGDNGYYAVNFLWKLRGALDRLVGGPGLRRGRRHPTHLAYGDALDFWRVTSIDPPGRLTLQAEMKLPGQATLEFSIEPEQDSSRLTQIARFQPKGLLGLLYWYTALPLHGLVFRGMMRGIAQEAVRLTKTPSRRSSEPM